MKALIYAKRYFFGVLGLLAFCTHFFGAFGADFHSPRSVGLGGSGHAGPLLNDSIFLNPSFISFLPTYSLGLNYPIAPAVTKGRNYSVSIQDGRSEYFQAGAAYSKFGDTSLLNVGVSRGIKQIVSFGLGAKFFFNDPKRSTVSDAVVSVTFIPTTWLQVAAIADNVLSGQAGQDKGLYRDYILGLKLNTQEIVLIYFDPHITPALASMGQRYGFEAGLEFVVMSDLFLRAGAFRNSVVPFQGVRGRGYGLGVGWIAPRLSLDYGMSWALEPVVSTAHIFGATVYF